MPMPRHLNLLNPLPFHNSQSQWKFWKTYFTPDRFSHDQIPDLTGKVAIVTGANTGLGYATTVALAANGARVFMACRNKERAMNAIERAKAEIKEKYPQASEPKLEFMELDLNDMKKTRQSARDFLAKNLPLHILVCNAAVSITPFELSADGIETQFAVTHTGYHFVLTMTLLERLKETKPSRVMVVSSITHEAILDSKINLEIVNDNDLSDPDFYHFPTIRYSRCKFANVVFAKALARRLEKESVYVNIAHPGLVQTELQRYSGEAMGESFKTSVKQYYSLVGCSPEVGSLTQLYLATSPEIEERDIRGRYFIPTANEIEPDYRARDEKIQEEYWEFTENLVREKIGDH
ncbi:hypothetical protein BGX26_005005 [Mortierella sp. AD094]|nr:hypothetical protein BGX26_005005 [Mortierella sp. AD094]